MKKVIHIATECFPAAKAGGMGDVVGALPIYLPEVGIEASVVIPRYKTTWFGNHKFELDFKGSMMLGSEKVHFKVEKLSGSSLPYTFYCVDIPGKFDRESIYLADDGHGYKDEPQRNICFQRAVLMWLNKKSSRFDVLHCHDHMTGLIPFLLKYAPEFSKIKLKPTVFSIHNGEYRGIFPWSVKEFLPPFDEYFSGLLDWDGMINSLATSIKCADKVITVSPSYMLEIIENSDTLTSLYRSEQSKCTGILNGIDHILWDPRKDKLLSHHLKENNWADFKRYHKSALIKKFGLKGRRPLVSFIGRMAFQKGADIFPSSFERIFNENQQLSFIALGSGDKKIEEELLRLQENHKDKVAVIIAYDEKLAREIYAGSDFQFMPSRFEPCGLNQLYSMRYGTVPVVSSVGGLKDTVPDISQNGNGIRFPEPTTDYVYGALKRVVNLYANKNEFYKLRRKIVSLDYSWTYSAQEYSQIYLSF